MAQFCDGTAKDIAILSQNLPPSPPDTEDSCSNASESADYPLPPPSIQPQVLDIDKKTPDHHVPRDSRLIRLTGVHPFNVEPPLSALYDEGTNQAIRQDIDGVLTANRLLDLARA